MQKEIAFEFLSPRVGDSGSKTDMVDETGSIRCRPIRGLVELCLRPGAHAPGFMLSPRFAGFR